MSNPLDPEVMSSAVGGPEEVASLLARGILRRRLRTADGRNPAPSAGSGQALSRVEGKPLDVLREARDE